jgi:hypothetical protein
MVIQDRSDVGGVFVSEVLVLFSVVSPPALENAYLPRGPGANRGPPHQNMPGSTPAPSKQQTLYYYYYSL